MIFLLFIWIAVSAAIIADDYFSFQDCRIAGALLAFAWPFYLGYLGYLYVRCRLRS